MRSQLERAINLAADTGDKIIVIDELNDRSSVVMNLDEYERLLNGENKGNIAIENLTEEELLDKINRDIVTWREANKDKTFLEEIDNLSNDDVEGEFNEDMAADEPMTDEPASTEHAADLADLPQASLEQEKNLEENLYYYNEPVSAEAAGGETGNKLSSALAAADEEDSGFTSIKDELKKNKKAWEIPAEVKQAAEDVRM